MVREERVPLPEDDLPDPSSHGARDHNVLRRIRRRVRAERRAARAGARSRRYGSRAWAERKTGDMKLVDPLPRAVGQGRGDGGGEDHSDLSVLGVRVPLAHKRLPHTARSKSGRLHVTNPVKPRDHCRIQVPVAHCGKRGAWQCPAFTGGGT